MANFETLKGYARDGVRTKKSGSGLGEYSRKLFSSSVTWDDVLWLKNFTKLPLILKGILTGQFNYRLAIQETITGTFRTFQLKKQEKQSKLELPESSYQITVEGN